MNLSYTERKGPLIATAQHRLSNQNYQTLSQTGSRLARTDAAYGSLTCCSLVHHFPLRIKDAKPPHTPNLASTSPGDKFLKSKTQSYHSALSARQSRQEGTKIWMQLSGGKEIDTGHFAAVVAECFVVLFLFLNHNSADMHPNYLQFWRLPFETIEKPAHLQIEIKAGCTNASSSLFGLENIPVSNQRHTQCGNQLLKTGNMVCRSDLLDFQQ